VESWQRKRNFSRGLKSSVLNKLADFSVEFSSSAVCIASKRILGGISAKNSCWSGKDFAVGAE
jgi:hypothetical protein